MKRVETEMRSTCGKPEILNKSRIEVFDWGLTAYSSAWKRQQALVENRLSGRLPDQLILVEHEPAITLGRSATPDDLLISENFLARKGVELCRIERGGKATYHAPGQLVAYPVMMLKDGDLHAFVKKLLESAAFVLSEYGLDPIYRAGEPGIWVEGKKIASIGIAVRSSVTYHGVALNVNIDLDPFTWIVPCGKPSEIITSMEKELGGPVDLDEVKDLFITGFVSIFGYSDDLVKRREITSLEVQ